MFHMWLQLMKNDTTPSLWSHVKSNVWRSNSDLWLAKCYRLIGINKNQSMIAINLQPDHKKGAVIEILMKAIKTICPEILLERICNRVSPQIVGVINAWQLKIS